jgi:hypothetical protein
MKKENIVKITRRLIILVIISLIVFSMVLSFTYNHYKQDGSAELLSKMFSVPWVAFTCFFCGFVGGFVSIQQRIRKLGHEELDLLASSWVQLIIVPLFGGILALVLYILFLSKIISGSFFPDFYVPPKESDSIAESFINFVSHTFPRNSHEYGKLFFWCFIAGFSERFVPQLLQDVTSETVESRSRRPRSGRS